MFCSHDNAFLNHTEIPIQDSLQNDFKANVIVLKSISMAIFQLCLRMNNLFKLKMIIYFIGINSDL